MNSPLISIAALNYVIKHYSLKIFWNWGSYWFWIILQEGRKSAFLHLFSQIPHNPNQACIVFLIEHMVKVSQFEQQNKMSLHNLATVFGPTMLHSGDHNVAKKGNAAKDQLTTGTVDVMAQAGILHFFLTRRARGEPIQIVERQVWWKRPLLFPQIWRL